MDEMMENQEQLMEIVVDEQEKQDQCLPMFSQFKCGWMVYLVSASLWRLSHKTNTGQWTVDSRELMMIRDGQCQVRSAV